MILPQNNNLIKKLYINTKKEFEENLIKSIYIQLSHNKIISELDLNMLLEKFPFNQGDWDG